MDIAELRGLLAETPEEKSQNQGLGLLNFGLGMLANPNGGSFAQRFGEGGQVGLKAYQEARINSRNERMGKMSAEMKFDEYHKQQDQAKRLSEWKASMPQESVINNTPASAYSSQQNSDGTMPIAQSTQTTTQPTQQAYNDWIRRGMAIDPDSAHKGSETIKNLRPGGVDSPFAKVMPKDYTNSSLRDFSATNDYSKLVPVADPATSGITQAQRMDMEEKLSGKHAALSANFIAGRDAFTQLSATMADATNSPASTLAGATKFMKMIDPGSVVRESELGMALQAQGVYDRMGNYMHQLEIGKNLTPAQAKDFTNTAKKIYEASAVGQRQLDSEFAKQAKGWSLSPEHIVRDYHYKEPAKSSLIKSVDIHSQADAILGR